ncbi:Natterin-4 [Bienertia sinuspersici]
MGSMPAVIALYREQPEVRYMAIAKEGDQKGCIEASSTATALSPTTNFIVENAKAHGNGNRVHLRSPYNNKYFCRLSEDSQIVAAVASEPVEDTSNWNCTLFVYSIIPNHTFMIKPTEVSFTYIGYHNFPYGVTLNSENLWEIQKTFSPSRRITKFILVDVGSIVRLPKRVTLKGDNDKYLCCTLQGSTGDAEFTSDDNAIEASQFEIIPDKHGNVRIRSMHFRKIMKIGSNDEATWGDDYDPASGTLFEVVKVSGNVFALRNLWNSRFLKRDKTNNRLRIDGTTIVHEARLIVEEPVFERTIEVHFRLKEGRIYERTPLQSAIATVVNRTNKESTIAQGFNYTKTHTAQWEVNGSLKLGFEANFKSGIPFIFEVDFKVSAEINVGGSYGETNDFSQQVTSTYTVTAPPMTKAIVKGFSQQAKYDIPFSYYLTEHYTNGETISTLMEDGMYNGVETFDFYYEASYEDLDDNDHKIPGVVMIV